jgi:hypothetical protein
MGRLRFAIALALLALALPAEPARCGEVGGTLGTYASAGAGVGALLGTAAATLPYLQSKQSFDFVTGAGIGMLVGCGAGFALGVVDLANRDDDAFGDPKPGLAVALLPGRVSARWTLRF